MRAIAGSESSAAEKFLFAISALSCGTKIFSKQSAARVSASFDEAGIRSASAQAYLSGAFLISFFLSLAAFAFFFFLFSFDVIDAFAASILSFSLFFAAFFSVPNALAWKHRSQIESELPFFLREFAIYLDIGLPFEKAMAQLAGRKYLLSLVFLHACNEIKSGSTVQSSLSSISSATNSFAVKRCMLLLFSIYESGSGADALKRTADELSSAQLSEMRAQSNRVAVLAIIFIAFSALVPSFFSVYAAVSPTISNVSIPEWQLWLAFLFAFPLLNALALAAMFFFLPSPSLSDSTADLLDEFLEKSGFSFGRKAFIAACCAIALVVAAVFFIFGSLAFSFLSLSIAPAIYFFASYLAAREIKAAELRLPDALYSAASVHRILSPERMLLLLSRGGFGRLSEAFGLALRRQKAGDGFVVSLAAAARHCPSPLVARALALLVVAYETGANMYFALREAAQDVVSFFALLRERSALLAMQRYTILASAAILVPFILGTVLSIVPSLASVPQSSGFAPPPLSAPCQAYLLLNSALSSLALAMSESATKKAVLYFSFIAPLSQVIFSLASSGALSFS